VKTLAALVESPDHVCARYRLTAYRDAFATAGWQLELVPVPKRPFARMGLLRRLRSADAVLIQRKLIPRLEVNLLRRAVRRLLFDFDDAVWLRDSYSPKGLDAPRRARRFATVVYDADRVIAGNDYLAAEARIHTTADRVTVVPTCVEPAGYPVATHSGDRVRLVWVGSSSTLKGLERFRPTLEAVGRAVPNLTLRLVCDQFLSFDHLQVERVNWKQDTEAADIAACDVGIGWVPDDRWSRGKCGLKLLQYHAAGLPVVANPVGVQADMVADGVTGYQATTADEWAAAVKRLAADATLRKTLGAAGRRQVEAKYSVAVGARLWAEVLRSL
jgi:glycosyltransferase involved in cell wall biosynthesis